MLLLESFGRHHTCSSERDSIQARSRGQYCSNSFLRENSRNNVLVFRSVLMDFRKHFPR